MKLVRCAIDETVLEGDRPGSSIPSVVATCLACGHQTESYGTHGRSRARCLVLMREQCPARLTNHYADDDEMRSGTTIVNVKLHPYEVYIGRDMSRGAGIGEFCDGTFGNPVHVGARCPYCYERHETAGDTLLCYEQRYLFPRIAQAPSNDTDRVFLEKLLALDGQVLGCWCKSTPNGPESCHGDVIRAFLSSETANEWRRWILDQERLGLRRE